MIKKRSTYGLGHRLLAFVLAFVMVLGYVPNVTLTAHADDGAQITTVSDPYLEVTALDREIYGSTNDKGEFTWNTQNAGKVTVDKNVVSDQEDGITFFDVELKSNVTLTPDANNFLVQMSQSAQVMSMSRQVTVPIDAVFVLDTSGSMTQNNSPRAKQLMEATNNAIKTLMESNPENRVGVVAFSGVSQGSGTSQGAAANMLSALAHYTGEAATKHLRRVDNKGKESDTGSYLAGRTTVTIDNTWPNDDYTGPACRNRGNGGTNIQAGISLGGEMLASVPKSDTKVTYGSGTTAKTVTRMPVLIVVSDGNPTYIVGDEDWYDASPESQLGNGSYSFEGNAFMTMLTAAYWKGKITENYYGSSANSDERCSVYTVGLDLDMGGDNEALAKLTLNPRKYAKDSYEENDTTVHNTYWEYGHNRNNNNPSAENAPKTYWANYLNGATFSVDYADYDRRGNNSRTDYNVTAGSITDSKTYVNYHGSNGIIYNDEYFAATSGDLGEKFATMVSHIQEKAMPTPTQVGAAGKNYSGYVTFVDTIGEFMEVKKMRGIYADGIFFDGDEAETLLRNKSSVIANVMNTRLDLINSPVYAAALMAKAQGNSVTWWGRAYDSDGLRDQVQCLAVANDDSVAYIKDAKDKNEIPENADVVVRSYFFTPDGGDKYLHYIVRVMRSLEAPYQQTVTLSAPASLLSVDTVMVNEKLATDSQGNVIPNQDPSYTVKHEIAEATRVIYEVGLRGDINAANVAGVVAEELPGYATEKDKGGYSENYSQSSKTYHFFTNDWDRTKSGSEHHRAMSQAIFEASRDNAFYIYQENTYVVDANGNKVRSIGGDNYVKRTVYSWNPNSQLNADGTYNAVKSEELIPVSIRNSNVLGYDIDGYCYIKAGTHAESTLAANGHEDTAKSENKTGTAVVVRHPHYNGAGSAHYLVLLGNNGKLSLKYEAPKTVNIIKSDGTTITDADGKAVMVGEELEYKIKVSNNDSEAVMAKVTDTVPTGTVYVENSAKVTLNGQTVSSDFSNTNGKLEWKNISVPANSSVIVSFKVRVTEDAISTTHQIGDIQNTATIQLGNNPAYTTNTVENPPQGKTVTDGNNQDIPLESGMIQVEVGQELTYHIQWVNDTDKAADVTITDIVPDGTTVLAFVGNATSQGLNPAVSEDGTMVWTKKNGEAIDYRLTFTPAKENQKAQLKWELMNRAAGATGYVSFKVQVNADAVEKNAISNQAAIQTGNNPNTNVVTVYRKTGNLSVKKQVKLADGLAELNVTLPTNAAFRFHLEDPTGTLNGKFTLNGLEQVQDVTFEKGKAHVSGVKHGDVFTIFNLPLGVTINITEEYAPGWVMNCTKCTGGTATTDDTSTTAAATGVSVKVNNATGVDGGDVIITNCYHPTPAEFRLVGTKKYLGNIVNDTVFTFTATEVTAAGTPVDSGDTATASVTYQNGDTTDSIELMSRQFYQNVEKYYLIKEETIAGNSMIMDTSEYMMQLTVSQDNTTKQFAVTTKFAEKPEAGWNAVDWASISNTAWQTDTGRISFTNMAPIPAVVPLSVTKNLENRNLTDNDTFTFTLYEKNTDGSGRVVETAQNGTDVDGNSRTYAFNPLRITWADMGGSEQKTFTYYIYENDTAIHDVIYDASVYEVNVTVTLDKTTGELKPQVTYKKYTSFDIDPSSGETETAVTFTNVYADGVTVSLTGKKTVENSSGEDAGYFEFAIFPVVNGIVGTEAIAGSTYDKKTGDIVFGDLDYTLDDFKNITADENKVKTISRAYCIKELIPGPSAPSFDPFMDYDETVYEILVTVTLNGNTGKMEAEVSGECTNNFQFTNKKYPSTITVTPQGVKSVQGNNVPVGLAFSFEVFGVELDTQGKITQKGAPEGTGTSAGTVENTVLPATTSLDDDDTKTPDGGDDTKTPDGGDDTKTPDGGDDTKTPGSDDDTKTPDGGDDTKTPGDDDTKTPGDDDTKTPGDDDTKTPGGDDDTKTPGGDDDTAEDPAKVPSSASAIPEEARIPSSASAIPEEQEGRTITNPNENLPITFTNLVFGLADAGMTHYFLIEEVPVQGIDCSKAKYLMEVPIEKVNGQLIVTQGYPKYYEVNKAADGSLSKGDSVEKPSFTNIYKSTTLPLNLTAKKELTGGRTLAANEFDFVLERDGVVVANAKNDADGNVSFGSLVYTNDMLSTADKTEGNTRYFNYIMREIEPTTAKIPGVQYDATQYEVVVKVEQAQAGTTEVGQLTAALHSVKKNVSSTETTDVTHSGEDTCVVFSNVYKPASADPAVIRGSKILLTGGHGRALIAGEFNFELYRVVDANTQNLIATATNDADGNFSFTRPYTVEGLSGLTWTKDSANAGIERTTINYRIKEVETGLRNAVTPVNSGYSVDVAVVVKHDKSTAKYTVESTTYTGIPTDETTGVASGDAATLAQARFYNKYEPKATMATVAASKILETAKEPIKQNQFSFQVIELDDKYDPVKVPMGSVMIDKEAASGGTLVDTALDADGKSESVINFTNISYSEAGTYFYEIREVDSGEAGYTYDKTKFYAKIVVTDTDGTLTAAAPVYYSDKFVTPITGNPTFTNHYGPGEVDVELKLKKQVKIQTADNKPVDTVYEIAESEFDVTAVSTTVAGVTIHGTTSAGDGTATINLGTRTFTHDMVTKPENWNEQKKRYEQLFEYTVTEDRPANTGSFTYDGATITVGVLVYDDGYGNMDYEREIRYSKSNGNGAPITGNGADTFVNIYKYTASTPLKLQAKKVLNNKALNESFTFTLTGPGVNEPATSHAQTGDVTFSEITYYAPGEYIYTIAEQDEKKPNFTYDSATYTVVVNVVADIAGNLIATPTYYSSYDAQTKTGTIAAAPVVFTNSYTPGALEVDLSVAIGATKEVTGADLHPDAKKGFQFRVTDSSGNAVMGVDANGAEGEIVGVSDATGEITFSPNFRFEASGTYHFYISEITKDKDTDKELYPSYVKDPSVWSVYIPVSYNMGPADITGANFIGPDNSNTAKAGELYILKDQIFCQKQANAVETKEAEIQPQADAKPVFVNHYNPAPTSVQITANKLFKNVGANGSSRQLFGGEFKFYLKDAETRLIVAEAHNDAKGNVTFTVNYSAKDMSGTIGTKATFDYIIEEDTSAQLPGVIYDPAPIRENITVILTTNDKGELVASVESGNGSTFNNLYEATPATAQITATKSLSGLNLDKVSFKFHLVEGRIQKDDEGQVTVVDAAGNAIDLETVTPVKTANSDSSGNVVFPMSYSLDDLDGARSKTYQYVLYEVAGDYEGMSYDTSVHPVTVTVTDNEQGALSAVVAYGEDGKGTAPIIYNTYTGNAQFVTLNAVKALTSATSKTMNMANKALNGKFTFQLVKVDADGKETVIETVTNQAKLDANGNVVDYSAVQFSALEYQEEAEDTYIIREVKGDIAGMTYDTADREVKIKVIQNTEDGQYDITVDYSGGEPNAEKTVSDDITYVGAVPTITNTYEMEPVKVSLEANKKMVGRSLRDREFKFQVHDKDGKLVAEAKNDRNGKVAFDPITLTQAGTYELTVSEVRGWALFVSYDRHSYTVRVEVSETDGVLKVDKISYPGGQITFRNYYDPAGPASTGDQTPLMLLISIMAVSAAAVVTMLIYRKKRKSV